MKQPTSNTLPPWSMVTPIYITQDGQKKNAVKQKEFIK
jgi:hypothetical protein